MSDDDEPRLRIHAWVLRSLLLAALSTARERALRVCGARLSSDPPEPRAFVDVVALAERLGAEGHEPRVLAFY